MREQSARLTPLDEADRQAAEAGRRPVATAMISAIIPIGRDRTDVAEMYAEYRAAIAAIGRPFEVLYVLSEQAPGALAELIRLKADDDRLRLVVFGRWPGEAAAVAAGVRHALGDVLLTLPADRQVEPADLPRLVDELEHHDVVVGRRWPAGGSAAPGLQTRAFHWLLRVLFGHAFGDLVCRARVGRREVFSEVARYGVQPHFWPLVASERGFRVAEVGVRPGDPGRGVRLGAFERLRIVLDILALYMVLKFIKKPLRFFGTVGLPVLLGGILFTGALGFARLALGVPLADRPALLLGVLMIVLGLQIIALGLIGEIIIFASGRRIEDYTVEKIIE